MSKFQFRGKNRIAKVVVKEEPWTEVLLAMSRPKSQLQFHNCLSTQFYSLFSFLTEQNKNVQKRDFLYRYVEAID